MVANIVYYHHHCDHIHLSGRAAAGCKPFGGHLSEYLLTFFGAKIVTYSIFGEKF